MIVCDPIGKYLDLLSTWDRGHTWEAPFVARLWECIVAMEENRPHENIPYLVHEHHYAWCRMRGLR
jgi:hypothetical protein